MLPVVVSPRASPDPCGPVRIYGWTVTGVGVLVELECIFGRIPYHRDNLWDEPEQKEQSELFCYLRDELGSVFEMTCFKTDRLYESVIPYDDPRIMFELSLIPVLFPSQTEFSKLGLFTIQQSEDSLDNWKTGLEMETMQALCRWLKMRENNPGQVLFSVSPDGLFQTNKLGSLVSATATANYIETFHTMSPSWGDVNPEILSTYVDLGAISKELADLVGYTIPTTTP
jgi:hypothetical protein